MLGVVIIHVVLMVTAIVGITNIVEEDEEQSGSDGEGTVCNSPQGEEADVNQINPEDESDARTTAEGLHGGPGPATSADERQANRGTTNQRRLSSSPRRKNGGAALQKSKCAVS